MLLVCAGIRGRALSANLVAKLDHAVLVCGDLREMERDISVELLEKGDPTTNQDRQDRIANFVGQAEAKAFAAHGAASDDPDAAERGSQPLVHKVRDIARVEFDRLAGPRKIARRE